MELQKRHIFNKGEILVFTEGKYSDYQINYIYKVLVKDFDIAKFHTRKDLIKAEANNLIKEINFIEINDDDVLPPNDKNTDDFIKIINNEIQDLTNEIPKYEKQVETIDKQMLLPLDAYIEDFTNNNEITTVGSMVSKLMFEKQRLVRILYDFRTRLKELENERLEYFPLIKKIKGLK